MRSNNPWQWGWFLHSLWCCKNLFPGLTCSTVHVLRMRQFAHISCTSSSQSTTGSALHVLNWIYYMVHRTCGTWQTIWHFWLRNLLSHEKSCISHSGLCCLKSDLHSTLAPVFLFRREYWIVIWHSVQYLFPVFVFSLWELVPLKKRTWIIYWITNTELWINVCFVLIITDKRTK